MKCLVQIVKNVVVNGNLLFKKGLIIYNCPSKEIFLKILNCKIIEKESFNDICSKIENTENFGIVCYNLNEHLLFNDDFNFVNVIDKKDKLSYTNCGPTNYLF